jgi:hypothetical protein
MTTLFSTTMTKVQDERPILCTREQGDAAKQPKLKPAMQLSANMESLVECELKTVHWSLPLLPPCAPLQSKVPTSDHTQSLNLATLFITTSAATSQQDRNPNIVEIKSIEKTLNN